MSTKAQAPKTGLTGKGVSLADTDVVFRQSIDDHLHVVDQLRKQQELLKEIASRMVESVLSGGRVLWFGNGGSAADCQHLAAELVGRFRRERRGLASIALTTDTSVLTAIGNDYGFGEIFRRQIQALCTPLDVVVGISTSGNSPNVCAALHEAKTIGAFTVSFTGIGGGEIAAISEVAFKVSSKDTARIQEAHVLAGHIVCDWVESAICSFDANEEEDESE
jgi:D-sedoheptulose 7-phosphate isomerase